jgi:hypothetical protein
LQLGLAGLRTAFLPLLLLCNIRPAGRRLVPVLLRSDAAYSFLVLGLSLSHGLLSSVAMEAARARLPRPQRTIAANLMVRPDPQENVNPRACLGGGPGAGPGARVGASGPPAPAALAGRLPPSQGAKSN